MMPSIPIGGPTDRSTAITQAAEWLASRPQHHRPHPLVPELKKLFGLSAKEACEAIRTAGDLRRGSH
jgi:hypothetical protein